MADNPRFRAWFGQSKVIDASGNPLVVFHGTGESFSQFDLRKAGGNSDAGVLGAGIYFDTNPRVASAYAKGDAPHVIPVYVSLQKPFEFTVDIDALWENNAGAWKAFALIDALKKHHAGLSFSGDQGSIAKDLRRLVQRAGYDGVIMTSTKGAKEVVAFSPNQVKSAIGNKGSFDSQSAEITEASVDAISASVLYHGTLKSLIPAIKAHGLQPREGGLWSGVPLIFAADAGHRQKLVAVMLAQISKVIGKDFHKMSAADVVRYGAIAVITDTTAFRRANGRGKPIRHLERADYYADQPVNVDRFLVDDALVAFCRAQFRVWQKANASSL